MRIEALKLAGTFKIILDPRRDARGYFVRTFDKAIFEAHGLVNDWVQENESFSTRNVVRGLHFQRPPYGETKLVRAVAGRIVDVFVDLRRGSATYGEWDAIELSAENQTAVYIPRGFAHGLCTPDAEGLVAYKVDSPYRPESEGGLRWNDPDLGIPWPVTDPIVSVKDTLWPRFREFTTPFE
jgi:dTDP-4-dehydrorhamnose 3,5-epimerase